MRIVLCLSMLSLLIGAAGCPGIEDEGPINYRCFDANDKAFFGKPEAYQRLSQIAVDLAEIQNQQESVSTISQGLSLVRDNIWNQQTISVCWEPEGYLPQHESYRQLVQEAVVNSWEDALFIDEDNYIQFVGWHMCTDQDTNSVRIQVGDFADDGPHTKALGNKLAGLKDGMLLNFEMLNWNDQCLEKLGLANCIYSIAVHEFGHALGLSHEHNRPDSDREHCPAVYQQGPEGDTHIREYDENSVMNYCAETYNNNGILSENDFYAIRKIYFPQGAGVYCVDQEIFKSIMEEYP